MKTTQRRSVNCGAVLFYTLDIGTQSPPNEREGGG